MWGVDISAHGISGAFGALVLMVNRECITPLDDLEAKNNMENSVKGRSDADLLGFQLSHSSRI